MSGPLAIGDHLADMDWLRKNHIHLHSFGLGFLQLKLNDSQRMHFWHPGFKREREEVHDHRYNFTSTILFGSMHQEIYSFVNYGYESIKGRSEMVEVTCEEGSEGEDRLIAWGDLVPEFEGTLVAGTKYKLMADTFHRIDADHCVTFLERSLKTKQFARVVRPIGTKSVCPFSEKLPEDEMWSMIEDCIKW